MNVINLLVIAGILCLLAPNAVDRNRESTFEEWLESSHDVETASQQSDSEESAPFNTSDADSKHEITSLYAAWYYFHQSVTLGHGVIFDTSSWKHIRFSSESSFNSDFSGGLHNKQSVLLTSCISGEIDSDLRTGISPGLEVIRHSLHTNAP